MSRRAGRTDALHAEIRTALRCVGCSVHDTSALPGFCDLVVRCPNGSIVLIEVKRLRGHLTAAQERLAVYFPELCVVHSVEDALAVVRR